jgi:hypothetical protein
LNGCRCIERGFEETPGIFTWVSLLEDGAACDQDLGACANDLRDSVVMDAAVHFNAEAEPVGLPNVR